MKCVICGAEFETKRKNTVCCSAKCKALRVYTKKQKSTGICAICGKEFVKASNSQRYCGTECSRKAKVKRSTEYYHKICNGEKVKKQKTNNSGKRQITPAMEQFFTKFALLCRV